MFSVVFADLFAETGAEKYVRALVSDSINGGHTVFVDPTCNVRKNGEMKHTTLYIYNIYITSFQFHELSNIKSQTKKSVKIKGAKRYVFF